MNGLKFSSGPVFQFGRFCLTGGLVLALDFTLIWFFCLFAPRLVSVAVAYVLAVGAHFLLNKWWVFQTGPAVSGAQAGRYLLAVGACWLTTVGIVWLALHSVTGQVLVAKAIAVPPTTVLGYVLLRFFVFRAPGS